MTDKLTDKEILDSLGESMDAEQPLTANTQSTGEVGK